MEHKGFDLINWELDPNFNEYAKRWLQVKIEHIKEQGLVLVDTKTATAIEAAKEKGILDIDGLASFLEMDREIVKAIWEGRWHRKIYLNIREASNYTEWYQQCYSEWGIWYAKYRESFNRAAIENYFGEVDEELFNEMVDVWYDLGYAGDEDEDWIGQLKFRIDELDRLADLLLLWNKRMHGMYLDWAEKKVLGVKSPSEETERMANNFFGKE